MDNSVSVSPNALRRYGETAGAIASEVSSAGAFDLAGNLAAMTASFGLIGQDFLAMFAPAQADHAANYAALASVFAARARHAAANAACYESTDRAQADALRAVQTGIDAFAGKSA
jgi:hypothetical protein